MRFKLLLLITVIIVTAQQVHAQGCVAVRSNGAVCTKPGLNSSNGKGWQLNTSYRYFHSYKHFVGTAEQKERVEKKTDVRNWQSAFDITVVRHLSNRWALSASLPIISNVRSSMYEHYGNSSTNPNARQSTYSFGVGDMRLNAYYWLIDPSKKSKGNVQAGLGIKLPTGDYRVNDFFHKNDTTQVLGPVDQSIQLGDGGTGFIVELNGYYNISKTISVYGNVFYLLNPREHNGVSTARGGTPSATAITYGTAVMSVPDQYMLRGGGNFNFNKLTVSAGIRMECIPSEDLIGGSGGFRRPGYIISAEPGVLYQAKKVSWFATVPVALERNRTQSVSDKLRTKATGVFTQGDAAFADYSINIGCSFKL